MIIEVEEAKHNEQIHISMKKYMNMSRAWTSILLHGCPSTNPLYHSDLLIIWVEDTNHNEEIVKCNKQALFSIAVQRMM